MTHTENCFPVRALCWAWPLATAISRPYPARLFSLWGFVKERVDLNNPQSFQELKYNTEQTVTNIDPETLHKVVRR
jgi:hypothetical protein